MPFLMLRFRPYTLAVLLFGLVALTSCGGGGGSSAATALSPTPQPSAGNGSTNTASTNTPTPNTPTTSASATTPAGNTSSNGGMVTVVAHTLKVDIAARGSSPMTTLPVTTPTSGSLILVQVLTQSTGTFSSLTDNMGNTYAPVGKPQTYAGIGAGSYLFKCVNAKGGPGQTWSLTKNPNGFATDEASIFVVVLSGASSVGAWSYSNAAAFSGTPITTTAANSVVMSFWGPADFTGSASNPNNKYTQPAGWTGGDLAENALNANGGADAWLSVASMGTSINATWSAQNADLQPTGSMWLVEATP
uniref:Uncharacterized protein n=1 Tax=mine drainage metagenome TaxID=410659 RepID=E6PV83_9ZZZZ